MCVQVLLFCFWVWVVVVVFVVSFGCWNFILFMVSVFVIWFYICVFGVLGLVGMVNFMLWLMGVVISELIGSMFNGVSKFMFCGCLIISVVLFLVLVMFWYVIDVWEELKGVLFIISVLLLGLVKFVVVLL